MFFLTRDFFYFLHYLYFVNLKAFWWMMKSWKVFVFVFLAFLFTGNVFAFTHLEREQGHFLISDSLENNFIHFRVTAYDSVSVTSLKGEKTHIDNEFVGRLRYNGQLGENFAFNGLIQVANDKTNRDIPPHFYDPYDGFPYNRQSGTNRTWDIFRLSLQYDLPFVSFLAGIDYLQVGVAKRNHVILRGDESRFRPWQDSSFRLQIPAPTPYFGYEFKVGPLSYSQYAAKLYHEKDLGKYMHMHRLEIALPADIRFGLSEVILYGSTVEPQGSNPNLDGDSTGREFEWSYVIPFIPYAFEEHYHGDRDNNALAFDLSVKTLRNWEFYGEMLWDDMKSPTDMFDESWWGNKWAASLGLETKQKIWDFYLTWNLEYTRIEPWVYTHHKGRGYNYTSYGEGLGSDLGPNSDELYSSLLLEWKILALKLHASRVAKDSAFGSSFADIHTPTSPIDKKFLNEETTKKYLELGFEFSVFPTSFLWLRAAGMLYRDDYEGYRLECSGGLSW